MNEYKTIIKDNYQSYLLEDQRRSEEEFNKDLEIFVNNLENDFKQSLLNKIESIKPLIESEEFYTMINDWIKLELLRIIDRETIRQWLQKTSNEEFTTFLKQEMQHFNILVIGKTGTGKSTLINEILKLKNEEKSKEGIGKPITFETKSYEKNGLRLYDFRGIEISNNYGIEQVKNEIQNTIEKGKEKNSLDEIIHCIWYLFTGTRFENNSEGEMLRNLRNVYKDIAMPIILVYSLDCRGMTNQIRQSVSNHLNQENFSFIPILARRKGNLPQKGLNELIRTSVTKIQASVESIFFQLVKEKMLKLSKVYLNKENLCINLIKIRAKSNLNDDPEKEKKMDSFSEEMVGLLEDLCRTLVGKSWNREERERDFYLLMSAAFNVIIEKYEMNIKDFLDEETKIFSEKFWNYQNKFCHKHNDTLRIKPKEHFFEKSKELVNAWQKKLGGSLLLRISIETYGDKLYKILINNLDEIYENEVNSINIDEEARRNISEITRNIESEIIQGLINQ